MSRKPAEERASERVRIGAPATLKWGEQELTGFVEVVNLAGMYVATPRVPEGDFVSCGAVRCCVTETLEG